VAGLGLATWWGVGQDRGEDVPQQMTRRVVFTGFGGVQVDLLLDGATIERHHPAAPLAAQPLQPAAAIAKCSELAHKMAADTADRKYFNVNGFGGLVARLD
jgi:hypothetical protein